jgi:hypothetical protein
MKRSSTVGSLVLGAAAVLASTAARAAEPEPAKGGGALTATGSAPLNLDATPPAGEAKKNSGAGIGLNPNTPQITGGTNISAKEAESLSPTTATAGADEWKFDFHGYMRAPMRVSWGPPTPSTLPPNGDPAFKGLQPSDAPSGTQLHSWPRVPGGSYITWEYTNTVPGPWAQLNFSYGNSKAMMTVIVDSYSQTSGGYRDLQAQQGIDQAFLTLNFPEAFGDRGGLVWNIGSFQNRYGTAGKYDGGMYETYLFGRTHVVGETLTANIELAPDWGLTIEKGVGAKVEVVPFTNNQLYQVFKGQAGANCYNVTDFGQRCRDNNGFGAQRYLSDRDAEYLPYSGPVPQGSTFLAHGHLGLAFRKLLTMGLHFIYTWTPDDNWSGVQGLEPGTEDTTAGNSQVKNVSNRVPRVLGPTPGSIMVMGGDLRLNGGVYGDGYIGVSHIRARNINALGDSLEVLHSSAGWQFKENYFGLTFDPHTGSYQGPQNESGNVTTVEGQYSFSFGALANYPAAFWGQGPDIVATVFGMFTIVDSPAPVVHNALSNKDEVQGAAASLVSPTVSDWNIQTKKLKFGADVMYTPLSWVGFGCRFDMVQPDMDAKFNGSHSNFSVISPRVVFKTAFLTHEAVTINYQRYFLNDASYSVYPNEWVAKPDANLFAIAATMWW